MSKKEWKTEGRVSKRKKGRREKFGEDEQDGYRENPRKKKNKKISIFLHAFLES